MSYDIRFAVKVEGCSDVFAVIGQPEYDSPTYNVREIFVKSMDWDYHQGEWYKVTEIIPKIERGIHELRFNGNNYKKYEPDNGWGSVATALSALLSIMKWLTEDIRNSWNADVPLENIYMRW